MKAVILAAGKGTRLHPLTDRIAKPLMPIVNQPIIQHILNSLSGISPQAIYANLFYRPDDLIGFFDSQTADMRIGWKIEAILTGPAGAVRRFYDELIGEKLIIVISGDALHDIDLDDFVKFHQSHNAQLSVVMKEVTNPQLYGVGQIDITQRIIRFVEKPNNPALQTGLVSCGIYCFGGELIDRIPPDCEYDFGKHLIPLMASRSEAVYAYKTSAYWRDIGTHTDLLLGNLDALSGRVKVHMPGTEIAHGIYVQDTNIPENVHLTPPVLIGKNVQIAPRVTLVGPVVIGSDVILGESVYIKESVIMDKSVITDKSVLINALYGRV